MVVDPITAGWRPTREHERDRLHESDGLRCVCGFRCATVSQLRAHLPRRLPTAMDLRHGAQGAVPRAGMVDGHWWLCACGQRYSEYWQLRDHSLEMAA